MVAATITAGMRPTLSDGVGTIQVRRDRGHDDPRLDRDQVDADQRDAHPCVDDDPLVKNTVEHVDDTGAGRTTLERHQLSPTPSRARSIPSAFRPPGLTGPPVTTRRTTQARQYR